MQIKKNLYEPSKKYQKRRKRTIRYKMKNL